MQLNREELEYCKGEHENNIDDIMAKFSLLPALCPMIDKDFSKYCQFWKLFLVLLGLVWSGLGSQELEAILSFLEENVHCGLQAFSLT